MRLSIKPIKSFANINYFDFASEWIIRAGEPVDLYFQLVDADQENLRYLPQDPAYVVQVTFPSVNSANIITKTAVQVDPLDRSILRVSLLATEIPSTGNVQFSVQENGQTRRFSYMQGLMVEPINDGGC